jgi:hypothetical protein
MVSVALGGLAKVVAVYPESVMFYLAFDFNRVL